MISLHASARCAHWIAYPLATSLIMALTSALPAQERAATADATTRFSYQSLLRKPGGLVDGNYDLDFRLYDSATGGTLLASNTRTPVIVISGLFEVELDFGTSAFTGAPRYLEIGVRAAGSPLPYAYLSPRRLLTTAGHALFAESSAWNGLLGVPPGFADGTDDGTSYTIGPGLQQSGTQLSVAFAGSGGSTAASRADHTHASLTGPGGTPSVALSTTTAGDVVVESGDIVFDPAKGIRSSVGARIATGGAGATFRIQAGPGGNLLALADSAGIDRVIVNGVGGIQFDGQKACSVNVGPGTFRDTLLVPSSWTAATCGAYRDYVRGVAPGQYVLGCVFLNSFAFGVPNGGLPSPNCGW